MKMEVNTLLTVFPCWHVNVPLMTTFVFYRRYLSYRESGRFFATGLFLNSCTVSGEPSMIDLRNLRNPAFPYDAQKKRKKKKTEERTKMLQLESRYSSSIDFPPKRRKTKYAAGFDVASSFLSQRLVKRFSDVPLPPQLCMFHSHSGKELTRITTVNPG